MVDRGGAQPLTDRVRDVMLDGDERLRDRPPYCARRVRGVDPRCLFFWLHQTPNFGQRERCGVALHRMYPGVMLALPESLADQPPQYVEVPDARARLAEAAARDSLAVTSLARDARIGLAGLTIDWPS